MALDVAMKLSLQDREKDKTQTHVMIDHSNIFIGAQIVVDEKTGRVKVKADGKLEMDPTIRVDPKKLMTWVRERERERRVCIEREGERWTLTVL